MKYLASLLVALGATAASAATVSITSTIPAGGNLHGAATAQVALKNDAGEVLPAGMRLRVGFFVGYTGALDTTLKSPGGVFTLMSSESPNQFVPLGEPPTRVGYGDNVSANLVTKIVASQLRWSANITNVSYSGASNDGADNNTLATGGPSRGTRLFLLVYNTGDLAATPSSPGFEYGLFSDPAWIVPESGTATLSINAALIDQASEVFFGRIGNSLHTAPVVPEPSTTMVSLLAGLGLIARRRR